VRAADTAGTTVAPTGDGATPPTWELTTRPPDDAPERTGLCLRHYDNDMSTGMFRKAAEALGKDKTPGPPRKQVCISVHCRSCSRLCHVVVPSAGADGDALCCVQLQTGAFLRLPSVALRCRNVVDLVCTPPTLVHARTRAGYLCTACLACTGVHVATMGIGQGKAPPCKHDASNSFATADQLLASACACRADAVAIAAAAAVDVSLSFRAGQTIAQDVVRWREGLSSAQRCSAVTKKIPPRKDHLSAKDRALVRSFFVE
jgi:hypothetical protein